MNRLAIWRSPYSKFGIFTEFPDDLQFESITGLKAYSDEELARIAGNGFNAIWLHVQLHHIISSPFFPEFAPNSQQHIDSLRKLCVRAAKHRIKVFLYMQPPRAISVSNTEFWQKHMDIGGIELNATGDDNKPFVVRSLCTSTQYVRDYLRQAFADLTRKVPELGGYIIISASEYPAHCYSGRNCRPGEIRPRKQILDHVPCSCPRCSLRQPEEVVVELLNTIRDGVRNASSEMPLIFWNWSWTMYLDTPCEAIITGLPQDIFLLADFERGGFREDGVRIDEYSLGYSGPSEQFLEVAAVAQQCGIEVMPKFQLGTTHELATVRSLPIFPSLFRKAQYVKEHNSPGFLGCWNFGNLESSSLEAFNFFLALPSGEKEDEALFAFAAHKFKNADPVKIVKAWYLFAEAMKSYPFCVPFLYDSPLNHTLALAPQPGPLDGKIVGRSWLPDERGEDYCKSITELFDLDNIIVRLDKMAEIWQKGIDFLIAAGVKDGVDLATAVICGAVWGSGANMYRIYRLKKEWQCNMMPEYREIAAREIALLENVLPFVMADAEQGWHVEGDFYSFNGEMIKKKIDFLRNFVSSPV